MHGLDKIFLPDGTLFIVQDHPNEKALMKASVRCEDDTFAGIRSWYANFVQECHDYGFYVHPLWCFRKDHGGDHGFSVGNDPEDDLPSNLEIKISKMVNPLYRILSKKDMFPAKGNLPAIVRTCNGDGYRANKSIRFVTHPAFHDQPAKMIKRYPLQKESLLLEYYKSFVDYQQLCAYISPLFAKSLNIFAALKTGASISYERTKIILYQIVPITHFWLMHP